MNALEPACRRGQQPEWGETRSGSMRSTTARPPITKALLNVIADAKTKVYGDADPSLTYQVSGLKNGDTAGAVLNGGSLSRVAGENVGVYGINQGDLALNSGNYDLSYQGNNLTITKALLNVIADAKTKVYGDADPSLTYQVSGLKNPAVWTMDSRPSRRAGR